MRHTTAPIDLVCERQPPARQDSGDFSAPVIAKRFRTPAGKSGTNELNTK
jgi:hypothetical protein